MDSQIKQAVYEAAHQTAVFIDRSQLGMLKITGGTRLDLINRMSTQAVNGLQSGQGAATILTTDIGRIIDRLILYVSSDTVYALTGANFGDDIARYLMRFVFFNDDFHIEDVSAETAIYGVYGPQAGALLTQVGFPEVALPLHHWRQVQIEGRTAYLHRTDPICGDGYLVMAALSDQMAMRDRLLAAGVVEADTAAFEVLRIESGLAQLGHELRGDYIPLEAGLWDDVSFSKGCYIGQEIIARMESRGRIAKKLVKLAPAMPIEAGAVLQANGKRAGTVTSVAVGPNGPIALGYVKTALLDEEGVLQVGETAVMVLS